MGMVELEVAQRVVEKETGVEVVNFIIKVERQAPPKPLEKK